MDNIKIISNIEIKDLDLKRRTINSLHNKKLFVVGDILKLTKKELSKLLIKNQNALTNTLYIIQQFTLYYSKKLNVIDILEYPFFIEYWGRENINDHSSINDEIIPVENQPLWFFYEYTQKMNDSISLDVLGLPNKLLNKLKESKITNLFDLLILSPQQLKRDYNYNLNEIKQIKSTLSKWLRLSPEYTIDNNSSIHAHLINPLDIRYVYPSITFDDLQSVIVRDEELLSKYKKNPMYAQMVTPIDELHFNRPNQIYQAILHHKTDNVIDTLEQSPEVTTDTKTLINLFNEFNENLNRLMRIELLESYVEPTKYVKPYLPKKQINHKIMDVSILQLNLKTKITNLLLDNGVLTIQELINTPQREVSAFNGIGSLRLEYLLNTTEQWLKQQNIHLIGAPLFIDL